MPVKKTPSVIKPDSGKKARRLARAVIGAVTVEKVIVPRNQRKKPKHKKQMDQADFG